MSSRLIEDREGSQKGLFTQKGLSHQLWGIPELIHTFPSTPCCPHPHPRPGRPWPGGLADLRPPSRRLGATFPEADACQKLCGEKPPLGLCVAAISRRFWQRLCFKAALRTEIRMGSNWPTRGSPGLVTAPPTPSWLRPQRAMPEL